MSPAVALLARLRARGVVLEPDGPSLVIRPADAVRPEEVEALRLHKAEVLALLAPVETLTLDQETLRHILGPDTDDPHAVACIRFHVMASVREIEAGITTGHLPPRRLIRGLSFGTAWANAAGIPCASPAPPCTSSTLGHRPPSASRTNCRRHP